MVAKVTTPSSLPQSSVSWEEAVFVEITSYKIEYIGNYDDLVLYTEQGRSWM